MNRIGKNLAGFLRLAWLAALACALTALAANPVIPSLAIHLNDGHAELNVTGVVNTYHEVQYATNPSPIGNWQTLTNLVLSTNSYVVVDASPVTDGRKFYRVKATNTTITVTDAQLQDMSSRLCDLLTANPAIPETISITSSAPTNTVTAAEMYALMANWLQYFSTHGSTPPATVTVARGIVPPAFTTGIETGNLYQTNFAAVAAASANYIQANGALSDYTFIGSLKITTKSMLWVYARTINWYQDHTHTMPAYTTIKPVAAPASWPQIAPSAGLRVAVFTDPDGGSTTPDCVTATVSILSTNDGFTVSTITGADIRADKLTNYDVVMFPGGSGTGQATALQQTGCVKVEQFVARGGGFIGTCAGAFLASLGYNTQTAWLQIVDSTIIDVDHWERGETNSLRIHLTNPSHPIFAGLGLGEYFNAVYANGPLLSPGNDPNLPDYTLDAVYDGDIHFNGPAGVMPGTGTFTTSTYQSGRCVLIGFHPELTPGLWPIDLRAIQWAAGKLD